MPRRRGFPDEIRAFIARSVRSVGHLEALFLLAENRDRAFSEEELSRELRTSGTSARRQIQDLLADGLLVEDGLRVEDAGAEPRVRFAPDSPDAEECIRALESLYRERKTAVIDAIYSKPIDSIRSFADAFRIEKE